MRGHVRRWRARASDRRRCSGLAFLLLSLLTVAAVTTGCGDDAPAVPVAAEELKRAAEATASASSLHVEVFDEGSTDTPAAVVDYNAPDRLRVAMREVTTIIVGDDAYFSTPGAGGAYTVGPAPDLSAQSILLVLRALTDAQDVRKGEQIFTFTLRQGALFPTASVQGRARTVDGRIMELDLDGEGEGAPGPASYRFSQFGEAALVEPPAPDRIVTNPASGLPPCGQMGHRRRASSGASGTECSRRRSTSMPGSGRSGPGGLAGSGGAPVKCEQFRRWRSKVRRATKPQVTGVPPGAAVPWNEQPGPLRHQAWPADPGLQALTRRTTR